MPEFGSQIILLVKGEPLGGKRLTGPIFPSFFFNRPDHPNRPFFILLCPTILLIKGEPLGGKGLTGPICPSFFFNP